MIPLCQSKVKHDYSHIGVRLRISIPVDQGLFLAAISNTAVSTPWGTIYAVPFSRSANLIIQNVRLFSHHDSCLEFNDFS
jgi:hypothetical protein